MLQTDLLRLSVDYFDGQYTISFQSTDKVEANYFKQLLTEKFGPLVGEVHKYSWHCKFKVKKGESYTIMGESIGDIEWWLYQIALERGWQPFSKIGDFIRMVNS